MLSVFNLCVLDETHSLTLTTNDRFKKYFVVILFYSHSFWKNISSYLRCDLNRNLTSIKPTQQLIDYGDFAIIANKYVNLQIRPSPLWVLQILWLQVFPKAYFALNSNSKTFHHISFSRKKRFWKVVKLNTHALELSLLAVK